ncbi:MAG: endonuclease/exonuclease/phosphatase family protein, partial [Planctomycetota bacterium JB042]
MTRTLTVATYNVHGFRAHFGRPDPRRTADVVRSLDADVVALQEMTGLGVDPGPRSLRVLDVLPEYDGVVAPTRAGGGGFGNALLTRHPVRSADCVDLSRRRREPRSALDVRLDVGGVELRVVSTHLRS